MNYLAHLLLAENSTESRIGNLLGDFVKGGLTPSETPYSEGIIQGIKTHRKVDRFTDSHPIYIRSKRRIDSVYRRFSGIIIDMSYDHFLANHWALFSDDKFEDFIDNIYDILKKNEQILPERLQTVIPIMMAEDWLGSYRTLEGIGLTFARLARRLKRNNNLATAGDELVNNYSELELDFLSFFPEAIAYVKTIHQSHSIG